MSTSVKPELTMELITIIVHHTQELEHGELPCPLSTGEAHNHEAASDTLVRIRRLMKMGLVSKAWQGAIMDPRLWTTFLNANLREDRFLHVAARSGDLPVSIWYKTPRGTDTDKDGNNSGGVSDNVIKAIRHRMRQVGQLVVDLSEAREETHSDEIEKLVGLVQFPVPNLHTLSLAGPTGHALDLTGNSTSTTAFGGRPFRIQHLEIMEFILPPQIFAETLVSLTIGTHDIHPRLKEVLPPWIQLMNQGDMPYLTDLTIRGSTARRDVGYYIFPEDSDAGSMKIPSTIAHVKVVGAVAACIYICKLLSIPVTTDIKIKATFYPANNTSGLTGYLLGHWGCVTCSEISLIIKPDTISLALLGSKSATITYVASSPAAYTAMVATVSEDLNPLCLFLGRAKPAIWTRRNRLEPEVSDTTWLTLDMVVAEEYFHVEPGMIQTRISRIRDSVVQLLQSFKTVRSLDLKRYDIKWGDPAQSNAWFDCLGLFERQIADKKMVYPLPGLQRIQFTQSRGGTGDGLHQAVISYARQRDLAVRVHAGSRDRY